MFEILKAPTVERTPGERKPPGRRLQNFKYLWLGL
jgi:hypothetical protein